MRRDAREWALAVLFQMDVGHAPLEEAVRYPMPREVSPDEEFARNLVEGTSRQAARIDTRVAALSPEWTLGQMAAVDRNVLRMAICELDQGETPASAVISEAVEMAKRYGGKDSGRFVNGILGAYWRQTASTAAAPAEPLPVPEPGSSNGGMHGEGTGV